MNTTERRGLLIVVLVFFYTVTVLTCVQVYSLLVALNAEHLPAEKLARLLFDIAVALVLLLLWGRELRMGNEVARWAGFIALVGAGVLLIALDLWLTTWDYP